MAAPPVTVYPGFHMLKTIMKEDSNQKRKFDDYIKKTVWGPYDSRVVGAWGYNEKLDMVAVELFGKESIKLNLNVWEMKEALGIGPGRYCVFVHRADTFNNKLKLLLSSLPPEKMFFYPAGVTLRGEFLEEPWLSKVQAISARPSLTYKEFHDAFCPPAPQIENKKQKVTRIIMGSGR